MWEKLTVQERWRLVGIYVGSIGLAMVLAFGWGRSSGSGNSSLLPVSNPENTQIYDLSQQNEPPTDQTDPHPDQQVSGQQEGPPSDTITVHVAGKVKKPGVYTLKPGQRVQDAIEAAGGALPDADLDALNLAAPLEDATKIAVLPKGVVPIEQIASSPSSSEEKTTTSKPGKSSEPQRPTIVILNRANQEQLETLPGVGPVTSEKILALRRERGKFQSIDELMDVDGIGVKKLEKMRPYLRLN